MRPGESDGSAGAGSCDRPGGLERGQRDRDGLAERRPLARLLDPVQRLVHLVAVGRRGEHDRRPVGEGRDPDRRVLRRLVEESLGRVHRSLQAARLEVLLEHRVGDVEREHHGAALLLARLLHRGPRQRHHGGAHGEQRDGRGGGPQPRDAPAGRHPHHARIGPLVGGAATAARPHHKARRQERQRKQRPEPVRRLEGHDSLGPNRQAATPPRMSRAAAIPAGQAVTSDFTRSVPMNEPSCS